MLKQRILTAIILILLVLFTLFVAPYSTFAAITAAVMLLGAWEWSPLMGIKNIHARIAYLVLIAALLMLIYRWEMLAQPILIMGGVWWILITITLIYLVQREKKGRLPSWFVGISGVLSLVPCWVALNALRVIPQGAFLVFVLLLCVWGADTGAYFVGNRWGKRKLAPLISPKKTWEGFFGGAIVVLLVSGLAGHLMLGVLIFLMAVVGDLFESLLKRGRAIKDSGHLLPGHGGILDRIDSLLAAAPIFALGIMLGL